MSAHLRRIIACDVEDCAEELASPGGRTPPSATAWRVEATHRGWLIAAGRFDVCPVHAPQVRAIGFTIKAEI